jgi:hypothetical protein
VGRSAKGDFRGMCVAVFLGCSAVFAL